MARDKKARLSDEDFNKAAKLLREVFSNFSAEDDASKAKLAQALENIIQWE